jgi:hypothetical protein
LKVKTNKKNIKEKGRVKGFVLENTKKDFGHCKLFGTLSKCDTVH